MADALSTRLPGAKWTVTAERRARAGFVVVVEGSVLLPTTRLSLTALAKKLEAGAAIVVTGYAKGSASLAAKRNHVVVSYLLGKVSLHITLKIVTSATANKVTVTTTSQ